MFTGYVIKYALTKGIMEKQMEFCFVDPLNKEEDTNMVKCVDSTYPTYYHGEGKEWCKTREHAVECANKIRDKKIVTLKRNIEKLKKLTF